MAAVHIEKSSVRVRVTCEFHLYKQFLCRSCFIQLVWSKQHKIYIDFIYTDPGAYLTSEIVSVELIIIRGVQSVKLLPMYWNIVFFRNAFIWFDLAGDC